MPCAASRTVTGTAAMPVTVAVDDRKNSIDGKRHDGGGRAIPQNRDHQGENRDRRKRLPRGGNYPGHRGEFASAFARNEYAKADPDRSGGKT